MTLTETQQREVVDRVLAGESMASIGRDVGLSRERVRQLALAAGVAGRRVRLSRREQRIRDAALEIIEGRENWVPARFRGRGFKQPQFEAFLETELPELYSRWIAADQLPVSNSGHANPTQQRCIDCHQWKPWVSFYGDKRATFGKSLRCIKCAKGQRNKSGGAS